MSTPPFAPEAVDALLAHVTDGAGPPVGDLVEAWRRLGLPPGSAVLLGTTGETQLGHWLSASLAGLVPVAVPAAAPARRLLSLADRVQAGAVVAARPSALLRASGSGAARADLVGAGPLAGEAQVLVRAATPRSYPEGTAILLTSGTSGPTSGCLHRLDALLRNAGRHAVSVGLTGADTVLTTMPFHYSFSLVAQALGALVTGARLVVGSPPFTPDDYLGTLRRQAVTSTSLTPSLTRLLLETGGRLPASVRMLTVGGDRSRPEDVAAVLRSRPDLELYLTYGLTEAGPRVSTLAAHTEPRARFGSVGRPLAEVAVHLRPVTEDPPRAGRHRGELLVRTDTALVARVGSGSPAEDAARTDAVLVEPGLVATRDVFEQDDDGYLYFRRRLSDVVVVRGEKVSLAAVRALALEQPGVVRCRTLLAQESGATVYDLDVTATGDPVAVHDRLRRELGTFLLPAERPRRIRVTGADRLVTHK